MHGDNFEGRDTALFALYSLSNKSVDSTKQKFSRNEGTDMKLHNSVETGKNLKKQESSSQFCEWGDRVSESKQDFPETHSWRTAEQDCLP